MAWMYRSNEAMFSDFDSDRKRAVNRIVDHYEMDEAFVELYVHHLCESQRDNKFAYMGFESEVGAFLAVVERVKQLERDLGISMKGARVLDIGCASGHAMRAALKLGASAVYGIEYAPSRAMAGNAMLERQGYPATIRVGSVLDPDVTDRVLEGMDFIFMFDVLEHVPSIEGSIKVARSKLRKGGKMIIKSGNPYYPHFMLHEPHYGLPGMILLDRASAAEYHAVHYQGAYDDVFEWMNKTEVEALLSRSGFRVLPRVDEVEATLEHVDEALRKLESEAEFPNEALRQKVLSVTKVLKVMRATVRDPEQMFCVMNFVAVGEAI
jgi:SAM-dependent methyltransferase